MKWWDRMPWSSFSECWALSQLFHSPLSLFIKRLFSSSLLSARRVVSSAFLRLLIFFPSVLTPACASSSPSFLMMYSAYKLNKQGDNIQPWHTPFPIWKSESEVTQSCPTLCDPWIVAHQAPPSMGFSRQEYWSGLPFPSPGDLPDPGIEPRSPTLQAGALTSAPPRVSPKS